MTAPRYTRPNGSLDQKFIEASEYGTRSELARLHARGAWLFLVDEEGNTPLLQAAFRNNDPQVVPWLIEQGLDWRRCNSKGEGLLHAFANHGRLDLLGWLLDQGIGADTPDKSGGTALHYATRGCQAGAVRLLLARGANPHARSNKGRGALHYSTTEEIMDLLLQAGVDLEAPNKWGDTPLIEMARRADPTHARYLAAHGARLDARNPQGDTALLMAAREKNYDVIVALLDAGADASLANGRNSTLTSLARRDPEMELVLAARAARLAMARVLAPDAVTRAMP